MIKVIAIIPARGDSKRFPGKNLHSFFGKPLITHSIAAVKAAKRIDRVIVSTDDEAIAAVSKEHGAEVPFMRPGELASDTSPVIDALRFTLQELERQEGYKTEYVVLLQPTTPVIEPQQIDAAVDLAVERAADSVINVSEVDTVNHPYNVRQIEPDGTIRFWQEELHYKVPGQDRPVFYTAANLWLSSHDTIINENRLEGKKNYPIIVPSIYASDIDFPDDLKRLEAILSRQQKNG